MKYKCQLRSYDCYHINSHKCSNCTRNELSAKSQCEDNYISKLDKINEFYEFLTGNDMPDGVIAESPKLSTKQAFTVIWFLQEITRCLPDHIEKCQECDVLFDSDGEGWFLTEDYELDGETLPEEYYGHYCDDCVPNVEFTSP